MCISPTHMSLGFTCNARPCEARFVTSLGQEYIRSHTSRPRHASPIKSVSKSGAAIAALDGRQRRTTIPGKPRIDRHNFNVFSACLSSVGPETCNQTVAEGRVRCHPALNRLSILEMPPIHSRKMRKEGLSVPTRGGIGYVYDIVFGASSSLFSSIRE